MSNISSNCLFHFTPKLEYLINIFQQGFHPRYCFEDLKLNDNRAIRGYNFGIPMTCFCDISLGQISNHISTYGNYGIGMKKDWGIRNRLNPIIYINKNSTIAEPLSIMAECGLKLNKSEDKKAQVVGGEIMNSWSSLLMYSKPYSGNFTHRGKVSKNVKFYNEREWRYIPTDGQNTAPFGTLSKEKMDDEKILNVENQRLYDHRLRFNPNDVNYIFVKEESEIHQMVKELRNIKGNRFNAKTVDILTSKILTTKQILEDF